MIQISGVSKKYGKEQVLKDITFTAMPGESIAIVGQNGCGKSTLLKIMAGIIEQSEGEISYFGEQKKAKRRKLCGYVPQENPLMEELNVWDNLKLWGAKNSEDIAWLLEEFELQDILKFPVEKLSGGMKRRLSIACAMLEKAPIMLLDEPTTAMDVYYKEKIQQWMLEYKKRNGIVILTTHEEKEIMEASRCYIMREGYLEELKDEKKTMGYIRECFFEEHRKGDKYGE